MDKIKPLDAMRTWNASQSWHARRHYAYALGKTSSLKLRFDLRRNAYNDQSYVRLEALEGGTNWRTIADRTIAETPAERLNYVVNPLSRADLHAIEDTALLLLDEALTILEA